MAFPLKNMDYLEAYAGNLRASYCQAKKISKQSINDGRLKLIRILEGVSASKNNAIMTGALVLVLENIQEEEYSRKDARLNLGYLYNSGSWLFTSIEDHLQITEENQLSDDERLVYLFKLYEYIQNLPSFSIAQFGMTKKALLELIEKRMARVKERESARIEFIAYGTPKLEILQKEIYQLMSEYERATSSRLFQNSNRKKLIAFMVLISKTCDALYTCDKEDVYLQKCNTICGVIIFALMYIGAGQNSKLFDKILEVFNKKDLKSIDSDTKIICLKALSNHIEEVKKKLSSVEYQQLEKWMIPLAEYILKEEKNRSQPSRPIKYFAKSVGFLAQYGVGYIISQVTKLVALPVLCRTLVGGIVGLTGPLGLVVYGATGAIIMTQLGQLVQKNLIPSAGAYIYAHALGKVGKAIANKTADVTACAFPATRSGLRTLLNSKEVNPEDKVMFMEWINTLLKLPTHIMPEQDKIHIRKFLGIEKELDASFFLVKDDDNEQHNENMLPLSYL